MIGRRLSIWQNRENGKNIESHGEKEADMNSSERYKEWLDNLKEGDPIRDELLRMANDHGKIEESFYKELSFGTAGLRGKTGPGTNCMNKLTVSRATQGVADLICEHGEEAKKKGVIIAHDPRHFSKEFSVLAAEILAGNGITTYVFPDLRPTPELAFLIRRLKTISGINITASHNPKDYNGYKAYWEDGCQVSAEIADAMYEKICSHGYFEEFPRVPFDEGVSKGLIRVLGEEYDRAYLDEIESLSAHGGDDLDLSLPFVYTPLNGAGAVPFAQMLKDRGFTGWKIVEEQRLPDPDFTTVGYPNPEDPKAFALSEKLGKEFGAELLMATDPDADRFAIEILSDKGEYVPLNGNQTGYLLVNYILEGRKSAGTLPENGAMVMSIVTSPLGRILAEAYGMKMYEALTGFKNICGRIPDIEKDGRTYVFGYEESVGYAASPNIRDKDGISAGMLVAEAAAYYKKQGKTLWDVLNGIYETYGAFAEDVCFLILDGIEGADRIGRMMDWIRADFPSEIGGARVVEKVDYLHGYEDIPASNVLKFVLDNGSTFFIRPSGTEPKIKFYIYSKRDTSAKAKEDNLALKKAIFELVEAVE